MSGGFFRPECEEMSSSVWSLLPRSWKQVHAGSLVLNLQSSIPLVGCMPHSHPSALEEDCLDLWAAWGSGCFDNLECFELGTGTTKIV